MQFTKAEEYGILGVIYLADSSNGSVTPLSEISEAKDIPEKFLAKIFQSLSRAGIVRSHRGVRGGFTLSRNPSEVRIKEVLEAIQGPYHLMKCTKEREACDREGFCALRELLVIAESRLVAVFEQYSLADLVTWDQKEAVVARS